MLCDEDREQSDRRFAEPKCSILLRLKQQPFSEELSHYDTWSDPTGPYLFWYGLHFFPLSNELRKHRALALGCRDVWESAACTISLQTGKEWSRGGAMLLSKDRSIPSSFHALVLSFFFLLFFLTQQPFSQLKSCFQSSVPERQPNLGALDDVGDGE